jgi:hypothetical protein
VETEKREGKSWVREVSTACAKALVLFAVAALLVRFGLREATPLVSFGLDDPLQLVDSVTGLILQLSTVNEFILLGVSLVLVFLALLVGVVWLRNRVRPQRAENRSWGSLVASEICDRQSILLLAGAAIIVMCAFGYQKALWTSILRVPEGHIGIGIISDASASELATDLQAGFEKYGAEGFALRPLPIRLDYRRPELLDATAVDLGTRIGARVVMLHRPGEVIAPADSSQRVSGKGVDWARDLSVPPEMEPAPCHRAAAIRPTSRTPSGRSWNRWCPPSNPVVVPPSTPGASGCASSWVGNRLPARPASTARRSRPPQMGGPR